MTNNTLISDKAEELFHTAQVLAVHQSKPFYIAKTTNNKFKITSLIPHSSAWKKEKLEWIKTVMPNEK
jgi:hypothetical protein